MKNSNNLEKSRGVVVFAVNTDTVDYVRIADQTSRLIQHHLNLPVTLITDAQAQPEFAYDSIVTIDAQGDNWRTGGVQWRNFGRHLAYELTPYRETILLDTDYLVLDDSLLNLFETDFDYKLMHHNVDEAGPSYETMGPTSLPFIWATVILFRKTAKSKMLFDLVGRIQRNYNYYRLLYNIREGNYRNDYALSIALGLVSGHTLKVDSIPWAMPSVLPDTELSKVDAGETELWHMKYKDQSGKLKTIGLAGQDFHAMGKYELEKVIAAN